MPDAFFFCPRCRTAQIAEARQRMAAQKVPAARQAAIVTAMQRHSAGWMLARCKHTGCRRGAPAADVAQAMLEQASPPAPRKTVDELPKYLQEMAKKGEALLQTPQARARARAFDERQAEREQAVIERNRREREDDRERWQQQHAQRVQAHRDKMHDEGMVEVPLTPGPRITPADFEHIIGHRDVPLTFDDVADFGRQAVQYAMEEWLMRGCEGQMVAFIVQEATRVQRGLYRLFIPSHHISPVDDVVRHFNEQEDAFTSFDDGPKSTLPMKWCPRPTGFGGPSAKWTAKQAAGENVVPLRPRG